MTVAQGWEEKIEFQITLWTRKVQLSDSDDWSSLLRVCCVLPFAWYLGADEKHNLHKISIRLNQPDGACRFVPVCFWAATRKTLPLRRVREQANVERNFSWEISLENFLYFGAKTFLTNIQSRAAEVDSLKRVSCFFIFPFRVWTNNSI